MQHRRDTLVWALTGVLAACSQTGENGQDVKPGAGGSGTGGSSTGGATATASHSLVGSAPTTVSRGGSAPSSNSTSVTSSASGGSLAQGSNSTSATSSASGGSLAQGGDRSSSVGGAGNSGHSSGGSVAASSHSSTARVGSKRGIAANIAPGAAFYPGVAWWYNWAIRSTGANVGIEFVPMVWDEATVSSAIPTGAKYLLGFNEPNFFAQANLSPTQAAGYWPTLQANASAAGVALVGPAMNYCGPASQCHGTDPYQYLKDFFAACTDCKVDYVAVHWYNCDLPSLRDYLEPGGNLPGFEQFGKPIWLTEFSCDGSASVAQQEAYMRAAIPYLESNPKVARYSWFSADPIPNARLVNSDGSPTALGQVYLGLPSNP